MALTSTDKQVSSLIINKVPSEDVYQQMIAQNLVNDNEIYIVQDNDKTTIDPATATPKANGTASAGTSLKYAREDHVHPKQEIPVTSVNGKTGAITLSASDVEAIPATQAFITFRTTGTIADKNLQVADGNNVTGKTFQEYMNDFVRMSYSLETTENTNAINIPLPNLLVNYSDDKILLKASSRRPSNYSIQFVGVVYNFTDKVAHTITVEYNLVDEVFENYYITVPSLPSMRKLTLSAANWSTSAKTYTATVNGILADATKQSIEINPIAKADNDNAVKFGVYPTAQGKNSITFSCDTIPTTAINFYVTYQDVNYLT